MDGQGLLGVGLGKNARGEGRGKRTSPYPPLTRLILTASPAISLRGCPLHQC